MSRGLPVAKKRYHSLPISPDLRNHTTLLPTKFIAQLFLSFFSFIERIPTSPTFLGNNEEKPSRMVLTQLDLLLQMSSSPACLPAYLYLTLSPMTKNTYSVDTCVYNTRLLTPFRVS